MVPIAPSSRRMRSASRACSLAACGGTLMRPEHRAMPLVSAECQFLAPAEPGDRCEVRSRIARFGGKSFVVAHDVVRADGTALAKGTETRVWGRFASSPGTPMKGETIPEALKALFRAK